MSKKRNLLGAIGLTALALISGSSYRTSSYYDVKIGQRQAAYTQKIKEVPLKFEIPTLPRTLADKAEYINRLERMELDFDRYLPQFVEYVKRNEDGFRQLTNNDVERGGTIDLETDDFILFEKIPDWRLNLIKHLDDFSKGNYSSGSITSIYLSLFGRELLGDVRHVTSAIDFLTKMDEYSKMSEEEFRKLEFLEVTGPDGTVHKMSPQKIFDPQVQELLKEYSQNADKLIDATLMVVKGSFPQSIPNRDGIYASWHTHPQEILTSLHTQEDLEPSPADVAGTFLGGPDIVFSQFENRLHVYAINRGKVREIFASDAR